MTILKSRDVDLHEGDGVTHITVPPGPEHRNLRAKLQRHLDAHARDELPELAMLGQDLSAADEGVRQAREYKDSVREYVIEQARRHVERGVPRTRVAERLGINRRTLNDWLDFGASQNRHG